MDNGKTFIIGDIHGCLDMFKRLMDKINWAPDKDALIFLGDYIDRGRESKGVVDYILQLSRWSFRVQCLMGNHESMFLDFISGKDPDLFIMNAGYKTLESYEADLPQTPDDNIDLIPQEHLAFFKSLKLYIELEDYYLVHAGFKPGVEIHKQTEEDLLWIREPFIYSDFDFGKKILFGHTPFYEPFISNNKIGLDTGAVYGHKLTCLELPEMRFHFVEATEC